MPCVCVWNSSEMVALDHSAHALPLYYTQRDGPSLTCPSPSVQPIHYFLFQRQKFIWDEQNSRFKLLPFPDNQQLAQYRQHRGLSSQDVETLTTLYGPNECACFLLSSPLPLSHVLCCVCVCRFDIPLPSFATLFKEHATAPFFVFQVLCVGLWCLDEYWYYSLFTLLMLVLFEMTVVQRVRPLVSPSHSFSR